MQQTQCKAQGGHKKQTMADIKGQHFKGWIDKESVTTMGWVWAIEEMDMENNDLVVFQIRKSKDTDLKLVKEIELFIRAKLAE